LYSQALDTKIHKTTGPYQQWCSGARTLFPYFFFGLQPCLAMSSI